MAFGPNFGGTILLSKTLRSPSVLLAFQLAGSTNGGTMGSIKAPYLFSDLWWALSISFSIMYRLIVRIAIFGVYDIRYWVKSAKPWTEL